MCAKREGLALGLPQASLLLTDSIFYLTSKRLLETYFMLSVLPDFRIEAWWRHRRHRLPKSQETVQVEAQFGGFYLVCSWFAVIWWACVAVGWVFPLVGQIMVDNLAREAFDGCLINWVVHRGLLKNWQHFWIIWCRHCSVIEAGNKLTDFYFNKFSALNYMSTVKTTDSILENCNVYSKKFETPLHPPILLVTHSN